MTSDGRQVVCSMEYLMISKQCDLKLPLTLLLDLPVHAVSSSNELKQLCLIAAVHFKNFKTSSFKTISYFQF